MDEQKQRETRIATLIDTDYQTFSDEKKSTEKREEAKRKLFNFVEPKSEKKVLPKQSISLSKEVFENEEVKNVEPEKEINFFSQTEIEPKKIIEDDIVNEIEQEPEFEIEQESEFEIEQQTEYEDDLAQEEKRLQRKKVVYENQKKPSLKLRLKLAICAIALVLTCLGGWAIYNAVEIKTLTGEAQAKNAEYNINVMKVIRTTSKLDDLTNPNSITNLDELESANVVQIIPKEKASPKTIEKQSNWFDRLCNWLSNLFK